MKGVPAARSQRYKAAQKLLQEQTKSTPTLSGNDVFPSPTTLLDQPTTQAEGAQRAFVTVRLLHQAMRHTVTPGTHLSDLLQLMGPYLSDCYEWYREAQDRISALQTQLDDTNCKLPFQFEAQNAQILKLQDELKVTTVRQEFYRQQAEKGQMVPPHRRRRLAADMSPPTPTILLRLINCISRFFCTVMILPIGIPKLFDCRTCTSLTRL